MAVARKRDAKAEAGKLAGPASHAAGLAHSSGVFRPELRAAREALAAWDVDDPSGNADLLASELVADAAEHAGSSPGITCEATDIPLDLPGPAGPTDSGRGRGLAVVTALATTRCARAEPGGKTAWFTRRPTASAVLPAVTGAPESLSHPRNTPVANLMASAGPAQALSWMRTPAKGPRRP
jgi:hypothetical protein